MKKFIFMVAATGVWTAVNSQSNVIVDWNDAQYMVSDGGMLFHNPSTAEGYYNVPKAAQTSTMYVMQPLALAITDTQDTLGSGVFYDNGKEWYKGPVANNYTDPDYLSAYANCVWQVKQIDIAYHIQNFGTFGYIMPASIANWPGSGNTNNGEAAFLAPFVDVNQNNIYEPSAGEYPDIKGDQATYIILNDHAGAHQFTGYGSGKLELHLMFYNFVSSDYLNTTTFLHARLINRSTMDYPAAHFGFFADFDLGNYNDDFVGSNSSKKLSFVYNGDAMDENNTTSNGFQANPPAFGIMSLGQDFYANTYTPTQNSSNKAESILNQLIGMQANGVPMLDKNGNPTRYFCDRASDNTNNEVEAANQPGDRRMVIGTNPVALPANGIQCYDFAFIYARPASQSDLLAPVVALEQVADLAQASFDSWNMSCETAPLAGIQEKQLQIVQIQPTYVQDKISFSIGEDADYQVFNSAGQLVQSGHSVNNSISVNELSAGMYILALHLEQSVLQAKFIKQ